jgi:hypothetical protein
VALASPIAELIVAMNGEGRIISHGSFSKVLANAQDLREEIKKENVAVVEEAAKSEVINYKRDKTKIKKDGKLIVAEEIAVGRVGST